MPIIPKNQRKPGAAAVGTGDFLGDGLKNAVPAPTTVTPVAPLPTDMADATLGQKLTDTPAIPEVPKGLADINRAGRAAFEKSMAGKPVTGLSGSAAMGGVVAEPPVTATTQATEGLTSPVTAEGAFAAGAAAKEAAAQGKAIGESYKTDAAGVRTASDLLMDKANVIKAKELSDLSRSEMFKQSTLQQEARTRATLGQINAMRMRMGSGTSASFDQQLQETYDMQKGVVGYLATMDDIESQDALRAYDYSMTKLDNGYNDTIQKISNMAATRIKDAQAAGKLSTMADISTFRNELAATFDEIAKTSLVFAEEKSRVSEYYKTVGDKLAEQNKLANEIDETASQQLGYLVNKRGQQYGKTKTPYVDYALKKALILQQDAQEFDAAQKQLDRDQKAMEAGAVAGGAPGAPVQYGSGVTDFTPLASKYPNVAAFKNNNPAGITWNANFESGKGSAALLDKAGITYEIGTKRGEDNQKYVKFQSIEDGLAADRIIMEGTYGNATVSQLLSSWVGT